RDILALFEGWSGPGDALCKAVVAADIEFHQRMFEASRCDFADKFYALLVEFFQEAVPPLEPRTVLLDVENLRESLRDHLRLCAAMADRDVSLALQILVRHTWRYVASAQP